MGRPDKTPVHRPDNDQDRGNHVNRSHRSSLRKSVEDDLGETHAD